MIFFNSRSAYTPVDQRQAKLDEDLARFPYVNGDLFAAKLNITDFDAAMREALIAACRFDWAAISPAIFGALFQSVMNPAERRAQGAHYTTEKNILKVIEPLFLDDLRAETTAYFLLQGQRGGVTRKGAGGVTSTLSLNSFFFCGLPPTIRIP